MAEADLAHSASTLAFDLAVIKFAPDGQVLVAGFMNGAACLWRAAGGHLHHAFRNADASASPPLSSATAVNGWRIVDMTM